MNEELMKLLQGLPPGALEELLGMGTLDERGGMLSQQLAQAQDFAQPRMAKHSTAGGAVGSGIGDLLRMASGALNEGRIGDEQQALLAQKDAGRRRFGELARGGAPNQAPYYLSAPKPFGF